MGYYIHTTAARGLSKTPIRCSAPGSSSQCTYLVLSKISEKPVNFRRNPFREKAPVLANRPGVWRMINVGRAAFRCPQPKDKLCRRAWRMTTIQCKPDEQLIGKLQSTSPLPEKYQRLSQCTESRGRERTCPRESSLCQLVFNVPNGNSEARLVYVTMAKEQYPRHQVPPRKAPLW